MKIPFLRPSISMDIKWRPAPHLTCKAQEGQIMVIDSQEGKVYHFNGVGAAIWKGVSACENAKEIMDQIAEQFEGGHSKIKQDVLSFLTDLFEQDLIEKAYD